MTEFVIEEIKEEESSDIILVILSVIAFAVILSFMGINVYEVIFTCVEMINSVLESISNTVSGWIAYLHFDKIAEQFINIF